MSVTASHLIITALTTGAADPEDRSAGCGASQLTPCHAAPVDVEELRVRVYRRFVETGGAPRMQELARELDESATTIRAGLRELPRPTIFGPWA